MMPVESLCFICANDTKCAWGKVNPATRQIEFKAVEGWTAVPTTHKNGKKIIDSYCVLECPQFERLARLSDRDAFALRRKHYLIEYKLKDVKDADKQKAREELRVQNGLCKCGRFAAEGKTSCKRCIDAAERGEVVPQILYFYGVKQNPEYSCPVRATSITTAEHKDFSSMREAAKYGFSPSAIALCCGGYRKQHGGFTWEKIKK